MSMSYSLDLVENIAYRSATLLKKMKGDVKMRQAVRLSTMTGAYKPLVAGSNPAAATFRSKAIIPASPNTKSPLSF